MKESNIERFEITIEEIDINSNFETVDKIAGAIVADRDKTARAGAIHDKIAEEVAEFLVEQPIEAIQAAERIDIEAVGPRFESSPN